MKETKTYIGDSVYMTFDGYRFIIFTDNGYGAQREIYLEPEQIDNILLFIQRMHDEKLTN